MTSNIGSKIDEGKLVAVQEYKDWLGVPITMMGDLPVGAWAARVANRASMRVVIEDTFTAACPDWDEFWEAQDEAKMALVHHMGEVVEDARLTAKQEGIAADSDEIMKAAQRFAERIMYTSISERLDRQVGTALYIGAAA